MATCMFLPTEHIFLCHETDASYAYTMAWHMKYEIIHGCRPARGLFGVEEFKACSIAFSGGHS